MNVLICKNYHTEGPGTIEDFLMSRGIPLTIVDLSRGGVISDPGKYSALVMMGGPMSVNEDDLYPYIKGEEELVRSFVRDGKKVFGVCLGAQIMAKALGARVYRGARKEIGWYDIDLTPEAMQDERIRRLVTHPAAREVSKRIKVFHWHGETFDIPAGAVRLASSGLFPNQAFRYGRDAYAFQFHIEVRKEMVLDWLKDEPGIDSALLGRETDRLYDVYHDRALQFYEAFFAS